MLTSELIAKIVNSEWCTLPADWEWTLRSNSVLRLLDLDCPGTFGIHAAYSLLDRSFLYVLITLPQDTDADEFLFTTDAIDSYSYTSTGYRYVVFYRKELGKPDESV